MDATLLDHAPPDASTPTAGPTDGAEAPDGYDSQAWLRLATEAFTGSTNYFDAGIRKRLIDDLRQFQGEHPTGSKYLSDTYRARHKFFRPKTRAAVRKNEAIAAEALFSTTEVISIKPMDPDDPIEAASAAVQTELLQYRLTKTIPWFLLAMGAYQDAQVQGMVCSYQHWDPAKDEPFVRLRPIENIRFDPSADWHDPVGTSPYLIDMIPMYVKDVLSRMKTIDEVTQQPRWRPASAEELLKASVSYSNVVQLQREGRLDPRNAASSITAYSVVWVHRNILEIDGMDYVFHTLGTVMMLDDPRPIAECYFHGERPYVIGYSLVETHRPYPGGPVRLGRDVQSEINEIANQRLDNVSFAMNKRWLVRRNAQVDLRSIQRNVPSSVTMVSDIEKDAKVLEVGDVTSSAYAEQDRLNLDFDELMGSFSGSSVQSNRRLNETVGGMNILTKDASQIAGYQLRTWIETWVEPVLRQLVKLEQRYETDSVVLALAGKRANLLQRFGVDVLTDDILMRELTLNVSVGIGAVNPHDKLSNFLQGLDSLKNLLGDGVLERYGARVDEIIKEIFGNMGYKDGARFFPGTMDPSLQAAQATIQQLQAEIEKRKPDPELLKAQIEEVLARAEKLKAERVKAGVETTYSAVQTAEVLAAVPAVAPVADVVMQTSGYQPPKPAGVDPNLQAPDTPAAGIEMQPVSNRRTGATFMPGGQPNTAPNTPANVPTPASPGEGQAAGIETPRADGVR